MRQLHVTRLSLSLNCWSRRTPECPLQGGVLLVASSSRTATQPYPPMGHCPHNSRSSALLCSFSNMATPRCQTIYRPVSLALCCFKMLEHLVHGWIAVHISNQLHPSQGGFMWRVDTMVGSFVDVLRTWCSTHSVDVEKAFDMSLVELPQL